MKIYQILILLMFLSLHATAQTTDSLVIDKNFDIEEVDYAKNNDSEVVEKSGIKFINKPILSSYFEYVNGFYTRNYGAYFSEISVRGCSPQQTTIAWYGVPINTSVFDMDVSLVSLNNTSDFYYIRSGASAKYMNALGGVINIFTETDLKENDLITAEIFYGNFGMKEFTGKMKLGNEKNKVRFSYSRMVRNNDFKFNNGKDKVSNSKSYQGNLHLDYNAKFKNNYELGVHYWSGSARKKYPTNTAIADTEIFKEKRYNRFVVTGSKKYDNLRIEGKTTAFIDSLNVFENLRVAPERNIDVAFYNQLRFTFLKDNLDKAYVGLEERTVRGISQWFTGRKRYDIIDAIAGYHLRSKIVNLQAASRLGVYNQGFPYAISLELTKLFNNSILLHSKISKDFRNPRLSEIYNFDVKNEDIKREESLSQELTINYFSPIAYGYVVLYNRVVDNWTLSSYASNNLTGRIRYKNIGRVHNYGMETFLRFAYPITDKLNAVLFGSFTVNYVKALREKAFPEVKKGHQLPLTPRYIGDLQFGLIGDKVSTGFSQRWFSRSQGLFGEIPSAMFTDFRFQANLSKDLSGVLSINNIFNNETYSTDFNPQQGRHLQVRFIFEFHP